MSVHYLMKRVQAVQVEVQWGSTTAAKPRLERRKC